MRRRRPLDVLQRRGYIYGRDWLPHDAEAKSLGTGKSVQEVMQGGMGYAEH